MARTVPKNVGKTKLVFTCFAQYDSAPISFIVFSKIDVYHFLVHRHVREDHMSCTSHTNSVCDQRLVHNA